MRWARLAQAVAAWLAVSAQLLSAASLLAADADANQASPSPLAQEKGYVEGHCLLQAKTTLNSSSVVLDAADVATYGEDKKRAVVSLMHRLGLLRTLDSSKMSWADLSLATAFALVLAGVAFVGFLSMYRMLRRLYMTVFHERAKTKEVEEAVSMMYWEFDYQPWTLILRGLFATGKQAVVLVFVYYQICMWNPNKLKILVHCDASQGYWSYSCEGTKAMARSLPLLCATFSMVITARFIVQQRLYYVLLKKSVLLDYTNYCFYTDVAVLTIVVCFVIGLFHWVEGLLTMSFAQMQSVFTHYLVPCAVFFVLFESAFDIERHLVPLAKFYEERPTWARAHLSSAVIVPEQAMRQILWEVRQQFKHDHPEGYSLMDLLHVASDQARKLDPDVIDSGGAYEEHLSGRLTTGLFQGLWPTALLMDPRHIDADSVRFRKALFSFYGLFMLMQVVVMGLLVASSWQDFVEGLPNQMPFGTMQYGGSYYTSFGSGYCRGPQLTRPYGMFRPLIEVNRHDCGLECSALDPCLGFAIDLDLCNLYMSEPVEKEGWAQMISSGRSHPRLSSTNGAMEVACYARLSNDGSIEDWFAALVQFLFLVLLVVMLHAGSAKAFGHIGVLSWIADHRGVSLARAESC